MSIRYYFDADILGVAKLFVQVRSDVTYPGDPGDGIRPPCLISPATKDDEWIPTVATNDWITITRDKHIMSRPTELAAVKSNRAKVVCLDARHELTKWLELEIIVIQWRRIEDLSAIAGPWIYRASRSKLTKEL
jgi:hypothetical protein